MFDIGFPELVLVAIVGLLVIGPERLPEALRALGLWLGRMRRSFVAVKSEIEKEIGMDEVRRQLHNEAIMEEMKRIEQEVKGTVRDAQASIDQGAGQGAGQTAGESAGQDTGAADAADNRIQPPEPTSAAPDAQPAEAPGPEARDERSHADAGEDAHADAADSPGTHSQSGDTGTAADTRSHTDAADAADASSDDTRSHADAAGEPSQVTPARTSERTDRSTPPAAGVNNG